MGERDVAQKERDAAKNEAEIAKKERHAKEVEIFKLIEAISGLKKQLAKKRTQT